MRTKKIYRTPIGNKKRKYRQDRFIISTFKADTKEKRRGIELCKELGFDMVEFGWADPKTCLQCMTACEEVAIDGIFQNWQCFGGFQETQGFDKMNDDKLKKYLQHTKKFRHVAGYYVWDEPGTDEKIKVAAKHLKTIEEMDPERLPFVVALPSYNDLWTWENGEYENYLRKYADIIEPPVLSLDYYPFSAKRQEPSDQLDSSKLFLDIALLREISLEKDIPMWFYFQSQDDPIYYTYRNFSPEKVRMQQYNILLHGGKGVQNYNVFDGAIYRDGTKGPLFYFTQELNRRTHHLGKTLMALTSVGVYHSPEVLTGNTDFARFRQSALESKVLADNELPFRCSVGEFEDCEKNRYLLIQNRDIHERRKFELNLAKKFRTYMVSQEDGTQSVLENNTDKIFVDLAAGDVILLRFQDATEQPFLIDYVLKK